MIHGLMWFPLLGVFIWLAASGWLESQKLTAYQAWATDFERSKYDLYGVLGQKGNTFVWALPHRSGPVEQGRCCLAEIAAIALRVDGQAADLAQPPARGRSIALQVQFHEGRSPVELPFTELELAVRWGRFFAESLATGTILPVSIPKD